MSDAQPWFVGFQLGQHAVNGISVRARIGGRVGAPPLLMLHGFPQTHAMWHRVAQTLAPHYRLVLPDLRGYGGSSKPKGHADHSNYSKRSMAADAHALMQSLGHERYMVAAHDRGARVAHRLALDQPQAVQKLVLMDIAPTLDMYEATSLAFATAYYHWFFLIQPAPLPETLIGGAAREYLHTCLGRWGATGTAGASPWEPQAVADYEAGFCNPEGIHGACEDYRAAASIDLEHDRASRAAVQKIACDLLALRGDRGVVHRLFYSLALWRAQCSGTVTEQALPCGHFLPEEQPEKTAAAMLAFLGSR
jgi:haloacetate dehalogenase